MNHRESVIGPRVACSLCARAPRSAGPLLVVAALGLAATGSARADRAIAPVSAAEVQRVERGMLVTENVPETPPALRDLLLQYQNVRGASFADWTPDGKSILIVTRLADTAQLHRVDMPLGLRRQLTFFPEPVRGGTYRPDDGPRTILYGRDRGGNEDYQLYLMDEREGASTLLTDGSTRNTGGTFSDDGSLIAWSSVARDSQQYRIFVANGRAPQERRVVLDAEGAWSPVAFSPDNTQLVVRRAVSVNERYLHLVDLRTGTRTQVNPSKTQIAYGSAAFSADGQSLYVVSDEDSEFARLVRIDLRTNARRTLSGDVEWDVEDFVITRDRKTIAYFTNEAGISRVYVIDAASGARLPSPDLPVAVLSGAGFSPGGTRLALSLSNAQTSGDVWVWDLGARQLERWTESEVGGIDPSTFVQPTLISWPTFDRVGRKRRMITGFQYLPPGPGPHPVYISIHGGPEAQSRPGFSGNTQMLLRTLGMAVILPNVRGSSGYGKTFVNLDNGRLREDSVRDISALLDWIATQPNLDSKRVVVSGGSYGGYMTYAVMTRHSDRLAAGISVVGISNFVTFLNNTSGYRKDLRRVEYGDERDPATADFLQSISPLTHASRITKPMFIVQGLNDPRVPHTESEQMLKAMRANGQDVRFMMAKDEGHGFARRANQNAQQEATVLFLQKVLGK
jgi:dipeptidyl aminopeptidase/acylaminoacyl peptidase